MSDANGVTSVHVFDGATDLGAATIVGGNWNFTTLALTDGSHSLTAKAVDTAGNTTTTAAVTATVDTTVTVIEAYGSTTLTEVANHYYLDNSSGSGPSLKYGGTDFYTGEFSAWTPIGAEQTASGYEVAWKLAGTNNYTVWNTDSNGNYITSPIGNVLGTSTALEAYETILHQDLNGDGVIGVLNVTGSTPDLVAGSDSGSSNTDNLTNVTSPTFTVALNSTVAVGDTVQLLLGGSALAHNVLHTITAADVTAGSVSLAVTAGDLGADGSKSISAKFTDAGGNTSTTSALAVTLDTTAPAVTQTTASPSTGIEFPGDTVTVTVNLSQAVTVTGTPTLTLNDGGTATYTGGSNSNVLTFSYTVGASDSTVSALAITAVNLPNGATITDAAGNTANLSGALTTFPSLQIDPPAGTPVITQFSPDSGTVGDGVTNATVLTLAGTAVANSTVNVYDGATLVGTVTADGSGAWSLPTGTLSNGPHSFTATDTVSGTTSAASAALNVTVDTVAPTGGTPDLVAGSDSGSSNTDNLTNVTSPTFTVALNSTVVAGDIVQLLLGGSALAHNVLHTITAADVTAGSVSLAVTAGDLGADGAKSISAKFTDTAGNTSTTSALAVTLDTTGPSETISSTIGTNTGSTTTISSGGLTKDNTLALSGTVSDTNGVTSVHVFDGATDLGAATIVGGNWNFTTLGLTDGTHSLTAKAVDTAGNTTTTAAVTATVDTTAPSETISSTIGTNTGSTTTITSGGATKDNTLALSGTVSDAHGVTSVHVFDGATDLGAATIVAGNWNLTTTALSNGMHSFTAVATDAAGNTTTTAAVTATVNNTVTVIEAYGSTTLTEVANHFYLNDSSGSGPSLKYGGMDFFTGEFSAWTPIGAEHTATGYEVAWINPNNGLYTAWNTDSNGNFISNAFGGNVSGTSFALESFETFLHQDLNGDGVIGVPGMTVIEAYGSTTLTQIANHYYLDSSSGSGPSLKWGGADFFTGEFGGWTPIGAEHTATGYEVAWINPITGLYTAWNTNSNGNFISNAFGGNVPGTSLALESLETILHQDLNGDGVIGVPVSSALAQTSSSMADTASNGTDAAPLVADARVDTAIAITASGLASDSKGHELLTGSAEPNSAISIYDDNTGKHLGQTTVDSFGTWSVHMDNLSNTVHSITATATDQAGHTGFVHAVIGTAGNDTITNGAANEVLFGNGGADTFVFSGNIGKDTIADFQASNDVVQLDHNIFSSFADVLAHATQVGHDVTITFDAADSVTLHDTMLAHLAASNFHLV